ncbi:MAG: ESX secretion-associated protein EspG [Anaerolineales bacterium]|nr:ESX secretion-associated protein EspG [Anaerolineales bacterium]
MSIRTELSPEQVQALGALGGPTLGKLSPLAPGGKPGVPVLKNTDLADPSGTPYPHARPALEALFHPATAVGLTVIGERGLTDTVVYHARNGGAGVALARAGESLWLHDPAPVRELIGILAGQLLPPPSPAPVFEWTFTLNEGAAFWAFADILRAAAGPLSPVSIEQLREVLDRPFQGLDLLAAYYRDCVHLPVPGAADLQSACALLSQKGLVSGRGNGFLPCDGLNNFAHGLRSIRLHVLTQGNAELTAGEIRSYRAWFLQGATGMGVMWFESGGNVTFASSGKDQILAVVKEMLENPGKLFAA